MVEEPAWTGRPCPWCGGDGYHNNYLIFVGMTACQDCGIEVPGEAWDTFSDAMALARAVERLDKNIVHMSANVIGGELQPLVWLVQSQHGKVRAERLAAALIALAGEVGE